MVHYGQLNHFTVVHTGKPFIELKPYSLNL